MWEQIQKNKRNTLIIFIGMGIVLILLGFFIGAALFPPEGGIYGIVFALLIWLVQSLVSYFSGDSILLHISGAREVSYDIHPQLFNIVEEMKIAANMSAMPKIYIIDEPSPNAFATGRDLNNCAIAVTAGLLAKLNRDELQGVIAHEMSHIANRDILYMTFAGLMLGAISMLGTIFWRGMRYSGSSSRRFRSSGRGNGQAQLVILLVAIVFAILGPILARIFYFAISRKREYLADASGVRLTRYPEGLASALEKISGSSVQLATANNITAPMYIVNPLQATEMGISGLFSTHPPIHERVEILRSMAGGVNYSLYQEAFAKIKGQGARVIPLAELEDRETIAVRPASTDAQKEKTVKDSTRTIGDLMRAVNNYAFLTCLCGLKIKIPPNFKNKEISCPRCGNKLDIPLANVRDAMTMLGATLGTVTARPQEINQGTEQVKVVQPQIYTRKTAGWESFSCSNCGKLLQLSPAFSGAHMDCSVCGNKVAIKN